MTGIKTCTPFIYVYGLIPSKELQQKEAPSFIGINDTQSYLKQYDEITAIVCPVSANEFSAQQVEIRLKDPNWLQEKAFHHHECIELIYRDFTVIPMSFCTIFQNEENLENMIANQYDVIIEKFYQLSAKEEWNLKVYCDAGSMKSYVAEYNSSVLAFVEELKHMPRGKQFIMKKKLERLLAAEVEKEQIERWEAIHQQLQNITSDCKVRKNWGKEITHRNDDMLFNCDYLIHKEQVEEFLHCIREKEQSYAELGWSFVLTGPWPPYHFAQMIREE